jgi:UV DNA damage endonuclease
MKIGYPCINRSLSCKGNKTFRLKSYSRKRFIETVSNNLDCLKQILIFNLKHNILFFRISSDIIPFASHPVLSIKWEEHFKETLESIGKLIKKNQMRISMHPDQFIVLNSKKEEVVQRSMKELSYHAALLNAMGLDSSAKIQLHVGGVYDNKQSSMDRFINHYELLPLRVKERLVIENDERCYSIKDCLEINRKIHIPVLLDFFHHQIYNHDEHFRTILHQAAETWNKIDGIPMIDYSSQEKNQKTGKHTTHIDKNNFYSFLNNISSIDADVMLEIKDKEKSALEAIEIAKTSRWFTHMS